MNEAITRSLMPGGTGTLFRLTCNDCRSWCWEGQQIRHSKRCDTPNAQWAESAPDATIERHAGKYSKESPGSGLTSEELISDVRRGYLSQSDAMNTDF